ncbi:MAG: DUF2851 family protein [Arachidicoccus sp.]|nr:DUF2851 family protein [Arachidicoccus sp.]
MQENLLQFIWQFRYFNARDLSTTDGEQLIILHSGILNKNQGPDFINGKIKINNTILAGNIELHVKSSDWLLHNHSNDKNYNNIILHVVWEHDKEIPGTNFPTLELQPLVASSMLYTYETLMNNNFFIPCEKYLPVLNHLQWLVWKDHLLAERLERKSQEVRELLTFNNQDWSETFWQLLAKNFGAKVNTDIFFDLAKSLPLIILAKNKHQLSTLEALLFGQCGLLQEHQHNDYARALQKEYEYLRIKYNLQAVTYKPKFLRMRPQNFPTVRLAQLAALIYNSNHLFSKILETSNYNGFKEMFESKAGNYWDTHYTLNDMPHEANPKHIGQPTIDIILINTVIPVLFAYGEINQSEMYKEKAMRLLSEIKAENNAIIRSWRSFGVACQSAFDSQALLELKNNYCDKKMCLNCSVGHTVLKQKQ